MSAKWRRSLAWDDAFFPHWAWPAKAVLRAFSSVWLAVILLVLVSIYGVLASVPIGVIVLGISKVFYGVTILMAIAFVFALLLLPLLGVVRRGSVGRKVVVLSLLSVVAVAGGVWLWNRSVWPVLHYDPATDSGIRFFADFAEANKSITLRRLPGFEMSELEFYGWWPLRVILGLFVANMIIATVRRIEFNFKNLGVLTVHTGIVTIAIGSIYYNGLKREGDTILLMPQPGQQAGPDGLVAGPAVNAFYDGQRVSLYVEQIKAWGKNGLEQRPLRGMPRYNEYNLSAGSDRSILQVSNRQRLWEGFPERSLSIDVPDSPRGLVDPDLRFRVIGYAPYAEPTEDWSEVDPSQWRGVPVGFRLNPLRSVMLYSDLPDERGEVSDRPVFSYVLLPGRPARRISSNDVLAIEYTVGADNGMPPERWRDLTEPLPPGTDHALVVETPGGPREVFAVRAGSTFEHQGFRLEVQEITPEPPFPIVTETHRNATSSVAVVRVVPPANARSAAIGADEVLAPFTRYVYHRFPELNQDIGDTPREDGRPNRRDADPAIRIALIDASLVQVYFDEPEGGAGPIRAIVRQRGGELRVVQSLEGGHLKDFFPKLSLRVDQRWAHSVRTDRPAPVPQDQRDKRMTGTHDKAMIAVEISSDPSLIPGAGADVRAWTKVVWVPFSKFLGVSPELMRRVELPDGRTIELTFGRLRHVLSDFQLRLVDFRMIAYDHRGSPRDFESIVRVEPVNTRFSAYQHPASLNAPLTAPYIWSEERPWLVNLALRLASGVNPNQYKFSQAAWDEQGWRESQQLADQGLAPGPRARFTILQVGNNPGIHVIALGGVLMGLGIPWAFYVKPWLVRREKRRIQEAVARGEYVPPGARPVRVVVKSAATAGSVEAGSVEAGSVEAGSSA